MEIFLIANRSINLWKLIRRSRRPAYIYPSADLPASPLKYLVRFHLLEKILWGPRFKEKILASILKRVIKLKHVSNSNTSGVTNLKRISKLKRYKITLSYKSRFKIIASYKSLQLERGRGCFNFRTVNETPLQSYIGKCNGLYKTKNETRFKCSCGEKSETLKNLKRCCLINKPKPAEYM